MFDKESFSQNFANTFGYILNEQMLNFIARTVKRECALAYAEGFDDADFCKKLGIDEVLNEHE